MLQSTLYYTAPTPPPTCMFIAHIQVRITGHTLFVSFWTEAHRQQTLVSAISLRQHKSKVAELVARHVTHCHHLVYIRLFEDSNHLHQHLFEEGV